MMSAPAARITAAVSDTSFSSLAPPPQILKLMTVSSVGVSAASAGAPASAVEMSIADSSLAMEISRIRRFSPTIGGIDDRRTKEKMIAA